MFAIYQDAECMRLLNQSSGVGRHPVNAETLAATLAAKKAPSHRLGWAPICLHRGETGQFRVVYGAGDESPTQLARVELSQPLDTPELTPPTEPPVPDVHVTTVPVQVMPVPVPVTTNPTQCVEEMSPEEEKLFFQRWLAKLTR